MLDVFIVDLFYFQINTNVTILLHRIKHFTGMPEYTKCMILNTLHVFYTYIYTNKMYTPLVYSEISIFSFLSLCVSKCAAWKYSIFIVNPVLLTHCWRPPSLSLFALLFTLIPFRILLTYIGRQHINYKNITDRQTDRRASIASTGCLPTCHKRKK